MSAGLDDTVRRMLASETFEAQELRGVLVERGHDEAEVAAAIARVSKELVARDRSPDQQRALVVRRRAGRLIRMGIFVLLVGLAFSLYYRAGFVQNLLILGVGGALIAAGYRTLRAG